jgi:hypothetical protein
MALLIRVVTICKLLKVFHRFSQVGDSYYKVIPSIIQSMGQTSLSQSIKIQNPTKSFFLNVDLVWKDGFRHGGQNKVAIETAYIPHVCVPNFLQEDVKKLTIKNHFEHILYGFKTYKPFPLVIFASSRVSQSCVF